VPGALPRLTIIGDKSFADRESEDLVTSGSGLSRFRRKHDAALATGEADRRPA
jgi:hypothetical protein